MRALARLVALAAFLAGLAVYSGRACAGTEEKNSGPLLAIDVDVRVVGAAR